MNSLTTAEVYITKLVAARRQLCAAIRMFFAGEDNLAIHTVASAAYRIITDLKLQRGRNEVEDYYLRGVFYTVRSYRRGTLPSHMANDPKTIDVIREWAEILPDTENFEYKDLKTDIPTPMAREFWKNRTKVTNFLKHADRDSENYISMREVDNLSLLMQAAASYLDLDETGLGSEGFFLFMYFCVDSGDTEGLSPDDFKTATALKQFSHNERLKFFSELLTDARQQRED